MYVTAIALQADAAAGRINYASAGQPTAYLRRAASGEIVPLESTTVLLGVVDGETFTADPVTLPFAAGDAVVAYTDGANEAMNDQTDEMLGMAGVLRIVREVSSDSLAPSDWPAAVMQRVVAHRNAPPADDTMIVTVYRA
jgi:serine phosphatase RsbU (regulator of sigma subunit)